ncbi:MAG TPA: hypothetical protein VF258_11750, partial [Luteolibacter sp.]
TGFKLNLVGSSSVIEAIAGSSEAIEAVQLVSPARDFLKSVSIEGRNASGEWQTLATSEVIFRQAAGAERLRVAVPIGSWEGLRLTVNDDRSQPIPFTAVCLITPAAEKPATSASAVAITAREDSASETRLTLDLGAANLNVAELRFDIPDAVFSRTCNLGLATPMPDGGVRMESLSKGVLYRVVGDRDVSTEQVLIPVHRRVPARHLVATFRNGDSPPLTITGAAVRCYPTVLSLHAPHAGTYRLFTGNRGTTLPDYDLGSLRGSIGAAGGPHLAPGTLRMKTDYKTPPALPGLESTGAGIDLTNWTRRRAVNAVSPGVIQIELDPWALAGCQTGLGDLRLIQNGRQIPYLIKPDPV